MAAKILLKPFRFDKSSEVNYFRRFYCRYYTGQVGNVVAIDAMLSSQKLEREIKLACYSVPEREFGVCLVNSIDQTNLVLCGKSIDSVMAAYPNLSMTLEGTLHAKEEGQSDLDENELLKIPISTSVKLAEKILFGINWGLGPGTADFTKLRSALRLTAEVPLYLAKFNFKVNLGEASSVKWIWSMGDFVLTVQLPKVEIGTEVDLSMAREYLNKMFLDNEHNDLTIVAVDGTEIKCQKCFLTVHSDVFKAMLAKESDSKESQTNRIELVDMSGDGVKAFLQFLYSFDTTAPKSNGMIALELLKASDKYNIKPLEGAMVRIFLSWPSEWQEKETVAIHLFCFARKADQLGQLKNLAVGVLKSRSKELLQLESYNDLFEKDVPAAKELVVLFCSN